MYVCKEEGWDAVSLQKFISEIHLRVTIDRFLRSLPLNKPFSVISDPAFTEANNALQHLQKTSERRGCVTVVSGKKKRNGETPSRTEDVIHLAFGFCG